MKLSMHVLAASVALAFAGVTAQAAQEPRSERESVQKRINDEHKAAMDRCKGMKGNAEDICKAEADGKKKVAEAELKLKQNNTPQNRYDLAKARAEAKYEVEKERCDDLKGDAKDACQQKAQAVRDRALADAKAQHATAKGAPSDPSAAGAGSGTRDREPTKR